MSSICRILHALSFFPCNLQLELANLQSMNSNPTHAGIYCTQATDFQRPNKQAMIMDACQADENSYWPIALASAFGQQSTSKEDEQLSVAPLFDFATCFATRAGNNQKV